MDSELPLVVDNGTGVSNPLKLRRALYLICHDTQFVKVGYAGSNFPEHGAPAYLPKDLHLICTLQCTSISVRCRSSHFACRRTSWNRGHQGYHDRGRSCREP